MYNFNLYSLFFNKLISLLVTISLLSVSFFFYFDENIKQELNILYEATSVCEYYNTITNFSYGIINKILESTNITLTETASTQNNTDKKEKTNNEQNNLYFVKSTNEKEISESKKINDYNAIVSNIFLINTTQLNILLKNFTYHFCTFKLICIIIILFCYFARNNIESININNIIKKVRLV